MKTIKLDGPVILDWGNGMRIQLSPAGIDSPAAKTRATRTTRTARAAKGRPGRKPSPATQAVIDAMEADHAAGKQRGRDAYLQVLQSAGYDGSPAAASQILAREAQRVFGTTLGRAKAKKAARKAAKRGAKKKGAQGGGAGRQPSKETVLVRQKVGKDAEAGVLNDATHYVRWLVKQPGTKIGLKGARPIVYRELRKAREGA